MPAHFPYDVFFSHGAKDKAVVRVSSLSASTGERAGVRCRRPRPAERLRQDGLKVWFDEWEIPVATSRQSAAFSSRGQTRKEDDGGALPRRRYAEKIEARLEHSRVVSLAHRMGEGGRRPGEGRAANAFGSDWAQLLTLSQPSTLNPQPTTAPLNQERRFIPLRLDVSSPTRLDDAPIKGSLAQFLYINWRQASREQDRQGGLYDKAHCASTR